MAAAFDQQPLGNGSPHRTALLQAYTDCLIEAGAPTIDPSDDARPVPAENMSPTYGVMEMR